MPKLVMIMNPHSGLQQGQQILDDVLPIFANAGIKLDIQKTTRAEVNDGKLDLLVVRRARRHQLIGMLRKVYSGEHVGAPQLEYRQVTSFSITTSKPAPLNIDGEIKGTTPVTVTLKPQAVQLL